MTWRQKRTGRNQQPLVMLFQTHSCHGEALRATAQGFGMEKCQWTQSNYWWFQHPSGWITVLPRINAGFMWGPQIQLRWLRWFYSFTLSTDNAWALGQVGGSPSTLCSPNVIFQGGLKSKETIRFRDHSPFWSFISNFLRIINFILRKWLFEVSSSLRHTRGGR